MTITHKTKALYRIEQAMADIEEGSFRHQILVCVKQFKRSWMELGQYLVSVHRDKAFKEWGYLTFEAYCSKEIGIRKETALKLLRSYYFLEKEEPQYIQPQYLSDAESNKIPELEAVDTLRQVKNHKELTIEDYAQMKKKVLEDGGSPKEVKDVFRKMLKSARELDPDEDRRKRRVQYLRRMVGSLNSIRREAEANKFLSGKVLSDIKNIIMVIERELPDA